MRASRRDRAAFACSEVQDSDVSASTISMQSVGQGGKQSSQPVQRDSMTACIHRDAPEIASTGQARMHLVQPIQSASRIRATLSGPGSPHDRSTGVAGRLRNAARRAAPSSPPGGQRFGRVSFRANASAYGRQASKPHRRHCVCGSKASIASIRAFSTASKRAQARINRSRSESGRYPAGARLGRCR